MSTTDKKFVLTHVFEKISSLTEERRFSTQVEHFNIPWRIACYQVGGQFKFYLYCDKSLELGTWSVNFAAEMSVVSPKGAYKSEKFEGIFRSGTQYSAQGFARFVSWEELNKKYMIDDEIILEIHVTIKEMTGVEEPKKLRDFEIQTEELSPETVLIVGDKTFYVSKETLSIQSAYFKSLLYGKFKESQQSKITLNDVDPVYFQYFLELMYMKPTLTDSNIEQVIQLTDMYDAKNGMRLCEQFLINDSNHSLRTKVRIAVQYKFEKLKKHCFDTMKSAADVRSVMGADLYEMDQSIAVELLEKSFSFLG